MASPVLLPTLMCPECGLVCATVESPKPPDFRLVVQCGGRCGLQWTTTLPRLQMTDVTPQAVA